MEAKKAIITGGSRGIGRGIAYVLASKGYDVAINYSTSADSAMEVKKNIEERFGRRCFVHQASLDKDGVGPAFVRESARELDGLDLLVNNAGVTMFGSILDMKIDQLDYLIALDFRNYLLCAQAASRYMVKRGLCGSIISITSSRGERAYPGDAVYGGVKAGINRAAQSMALDLAPYGIRVNNVAPGATEVRTFEERIKMFEARGIKMDVSKGDPRKSLASKIPVPRIGQPEDIGNAVAYLASDEASYITGVTLRVDGGLILPGMPEWRKPDEPEDNGWGGYRREIEFTDED